MHQRSPRLRAAVTLTAAFAAVSTAVAVAPVAAAGPATTAQRQATATPATAAKNAAGWLVRHLAGQHHDHYVDVYQGTSYPDYGTTADAILGMTAAQVAERAAARATTWLAANIKGYAADTCDPGTTTYYPGSLAKALLVAEAQRRDPHNFGGLNLISSLTATETPAGQPNAGLYADPNASCGYESPVTQALALIALSRTGYVPDGPDYAAVRWLVAQQCPDGGFEGSVRSAACTASGEEVDATSFALQALKTVGSNAAARLATGWLVRHRRAGGGFGTAPVGANVNSTALAVQGLLISGRTRLARQSQRWIAARQVGCGQRASRRGSLDYQGKYVGGSTQLVATAQGTQALAAGVLGLIGRSRRTSNAVPVMACR